MYKSIRTNASRLVIHEIIQMNLSLHSMIRVRNKKLQRFHNKKISHFVNQDNKKNNARLNEDLCEDLLLQ